MTTSLSPSLMVTDAHLAPAPADLVRTGLLAFVRVTLNGVLELDGLTIRRMRSGELRLVFPKRRDGAGREHCLIRPHSEAVRRDLEVQTLRILGLEDTEEHLSWKRK